MGVGKMVNFLITTGRARWFIQEIRCKMIGRQSDWTTLVRFSLN